jgi:hypothetical protein
MRHSIFLPPLTTSREQKHSRMRLNMDFGGPGGSWLPLLTRVIACYGHSVHSARPDAMYIQRLTFIYGQPPSSRETHGLGYRGQSAGYGRDLEACQLIDGPGGERIVDIRLNQPSGWMTCLEVREHSLSLLDTLCFLPCRMLTCSLLRCGQTEGGF